MAARMATSPAKGRRRARAAAAIFLARRTQPEGALAQRVEAALTPLALAELRQSIDVPFAVDAPEFRAPFEGTLEQGTILFAGERLVTVRLAGPRNVSLPWPASGVVKGEVVRIGFSASGAPRIVERSRADGGTTRIEFG